MIFIKHEYIQSKKINIHKMCKFIRQCVSVCGPYESTNTKISVCVLCMHCWEKNKQGFHHQKQNLSPADQIILHFESHVIAKIALIIFRLRSLISVIVLFYKYAKSWCMCIYI